MTPLSIYRLLKEKFSDSVLEFLGWGMQSTIIVSCNSMKQIALFLKEDPRLQFDSLICMTGVDYEDKGLGVIYNLRSMSHGHKIALKTLISPSRPFVASVASVWKTAVWYENEICDLFGVVFKGHNGLRRLFLPDGWIGHPLRKDYVSPESYNGILLSENGID